MVQVSLCISSMSSVWSLWCLCDGCVVIISDILYIDSISILLIWSLAWLGVSVTVVPCSGTTLYIIISLLISALFYSSPNWIGFFLWFEFSMLPMFVLIMSHSVSPERLSAAQFLFMYTIMGSIPLLIYILEMKGMNSSSSIWLSVNSWKSSSSLWSVLAWSSFMVKLPLFLVHLWLLKAHVEAPMLGSMFLAGVLLKFGGLGVVRLMSVAYQSDWIYPIMMGVSMVGSASSAILALTSTDIKMVVAYASVSHMNLGLVWGLLGTFQSMSSFMLSMVAHSFSSSLLFYSATRSYEETGSRNTVLLKGVLAHSMLGYFAGIVVWGMNLNIPPFLGLWGEVVGFLAVVKLIPFMIITLLIYFAYSSCYSMIMFIIQFHMKSNLPYPPSLTLEYCIQHLACSLPLFIGFVTVWSLEI
uniref:NADH-ubiquinone oxidoreductase chain 4 n=1 Tax=Hoplopleura kitti TaxID=1511644 RepID=A0A075EB34_9NEOP|nr:NADH dehydrogenase subunit 4 [Hoplopleura kitti]